MVFIAYLIVSIVAVVSCRGDEVRFTACTMYESVAKGGREGVEEDGFD